MGRPVTPDAELTWPLLVSIVMEIGGVAVTECDARQNGAGIWEWTRSRLLGLS